MSKDHTHTPPGPRPKPEPRPTPPPQPKLEDAFGMLYPEAIAVCNHFGITHLTQMFGTDLLRQATLSRIMQLGESLRMQRSTEMEEAEKIAKAQTEQELPPGNADVPAEEAAAAAHGENCDCPTVDGLPSCRHQSVDGSQCCAVGVHVGDVPETLAALQDGDAVV